MLFCFNFFCALAYHFFSVNRINQPGHEPYNWWFAFMEYLLLRISECLNPVFYNLASRYNQNLTYLYCCVFLCCLSMCATVRCRYNFPFGIRNQKFNRGISQFFIFYYTQKCEIFINRTFRISVSSKVLGSQTIEKTIEKEKP